MSTTFSQDNIQSKEYYHKEGPVHRSIISPDKLLGAPDHMCTVYHKLQATFDNPLLDSRPTLGTRQQKSDGTWGRYKWKTYKQVRDMTSMFASGLVNLGVTKGSHLGIYAKNRLEWVIGMFAAVVQGVTIVPLYDTLGPDAVQFIINHAEISYAIVSAENFDDILSSAPNCIRLTTIITVDPLTNVQIQRARDLNLNIVTFGECLQLGQENPVPHSPPSKHDLFTIMYTSGTTGTPKGVMLSHFNVTSAMVGFENCGVEIGDGDGYLSYLPLAHIMEMTLLNHAFVCGAQIGFWHGEIKEVVDDIQELRPTIFVGVPRVFNRIYDKINSTLAEGNPVKRLLFNYAFSSKLAELRRNGNHNSPVWDKILFSKLAQLLGGRVKLIISGSAPLAPNVQEFLKICFCCDIVQGYGLTETTAIGTSSNIKDWIPSHVGPPMVTNEVKLVDVPEMNYFSSNPIQQGEVCIRGNTVFQGYYKMPEKTAEDVDSEGWFHTGDVGQWNENGTLSIIDRKKNIFKLAQGEYVAAEYLENVYLRSSFVGQIFVYGDSYKNYLVAIVIPDEDVLLPWAKNHNIHGDIAEICADERTKLTIFDDLIAIAISSHLKGFEKVKNIHVEPEPWTTENGCLTPTMKMKRPVLKEAYKDIIEELYSQPPLDIRPKL